MRRSVLLAALLLAEPIACHDPVAGEIAAYHAAMDPLMTDNTKLASSFLLLAKQVRQDQQGVDGVALQLEQGILPAAEAMQAKIKAVNPALEELQAVHSQAITGWTLQAEAYREMVTAYKGNDPNAFANGQRKLGQAKVTVEAYVKEVNRLLEPYGYHLDEFPPPK